MQDEINSCKLLHYILKCFHLWAINIIQGEELPAIVMNLNGVLVPHMDGLNANLCRDKNIVGTCCPYTDHM